LRQHVIEMAGRAVEQVERAIGGLLSRDLDSAKQVADDDTAVDQAELAIDGLAFFILARRQPVARDLRFVIIALKVVSDLERMGDLAVNIAKRGGDVSPVPAGNEMNLELRRPSVAFQETFLSGLDERETDAERSSWLCLGSTAPPGNLPRRAFASYVQMLLAREHAAQPGFVTDTFYSAPIGAQPRCRHRDAPAAPPHRQGARARAAALDLR
jgi:hypothetical protein